MDLSVNVQLSVTLDGPELVGLGSTGKLGNISY